MLSTESARAHGGSFEVRSAGGTRTAGQVERLCIGGPPCCGEDESTGWREDLLNAVRHPNADGVEGEIAVTKRETGRSGPAGTTWSLVVLGSLLSGCLAQQADLMQLRRDVDIKTQKMDQKEKELQQTIQQGKADIERMVGETRARLSQDITVLREEELPVIRGALDKNAYQLSALRTRLEDLDHRTAGTAERDRLMDELKKAVGRLDAMTATIKDQMAQFSKSLADFKQALAGLGDKIVQGDQRGNELSTTLSRQTDTLAARVDSDGKATTAHLAEVNKSVSSLARAIEATGGKFMEKTAEQGRRLDEMARTVHALRAQVATLDETVARLREARGAPKKPVPQSAKGKTP